MRLTSRRRMKSLNFEENTQAAATARTLCAVNQIVNVWLEM